MILLNTMTGATAETRLVFLAWISVFGKDPVSDDRISIASLLRVKNRHLNLAIDYLVEEGFLVKRSNLLVDVDEKRGSKYFYLLRLQSWDIWQKSLLKIRFNDTFKHIVEGNVYSKSIELKKSKPLTAPERLVLALFVIHADSALHVVGFDHDSTSKLLGISVLNLDKIIRNLINNGYLTAYSHVHSPKAELRSLGRLYRIDALTPNRKTINIGLPAVKSVESIEFLISLMHYYQKAASRRKPDIYPPEPSTFLDEHYFNLSKIFHDNRLHPFMHHLCQSIIFSTVSDCLSRLIGLSEAERGNPIKLQRDTLTADIEIKLSPAVLKSKHESKKTVSTYLVEKKPESENELEKLTRYTIKQLSEELASSVITLVKQLKLFEEIYRVPFSIICHQPNTFMSFLTEPAKDPAREVKQETDSTLPAVQTTVTREHSKLGWRTDFVLTCSVPNFEYLNDCIIIKNELFIESSSFDDPRIQIVDEVKLYQINCAKRPSKKGKKNKKVASVIENAGR